MPRQGIVLFMATPPTAVPGDEPDHQGGHGPRTDRDDQGLEGEEDLRGLNYLKEKGQCTVF